MVGVSEINPCRARTITVHKSGQRHSTWSDIKKRQHLRNKEEEGNRGAASCLKSADGTQGHQAFGFFLSSHAALTSMNKPSSWVVELIMWWKSLIWVDFVDRRSHQKRSMRIVTTSDSLCHDDSKLNGDTKQHLHLTIISQLATGLLS